MFLAKTMLWSLVLAVGLGLAGGPAFAQVKSKENNRANTSGDRPNYFKLDPLVVPVIRGRRLRGQITFVLMLELYDDVDRSHVFAVLPRLRDSYFVVLKQYAERHRDIMRRLKLKAVKRLLMKVSVKILGQDTVRAVLVQGAGIQEY